MLKKVETGGMKVGELVRKIQTNGSKVGKVGRSARCDQEECMKIEQDAMLARRTSSSSAMTTSLERSCLGRL